MSVYKELEIFFSECVIKLSNSSTFIKDADAKNWSNEVVYEKDPNAVKFSVLGIMGFISNRTGLFKTDLYPALKFFKEVNNIGDIASWQSKETTTYEIVLAAFKLATLSAKANK